MSSPATKLAPLCECGRRKAWSSVHGRWLCPYRSVHMTLVGYRQAVR